jgi:hypothetical protein
MQAIKMHLKRLTPMLRVLGITIVVGSLWVASGADALALCDKVWVKKKCMPKIVPFTHNGQVNMVDMKEGQKTESMLTFYSGQDYRILVCAEETLENIAFTVFDATGRMIFDSKTKNNTDVWDFRVKTTSQLKVVVDVGKNDDSNGTATGCVSVLVGFKSQ